VRIVIAGLDPAIHPFCEEDGPPNSGLPRVRYLSAQVGYIRLAMVKPAGDDDILL